MSTKPPTTWPRAYLLSIYAEVVKRGYLWINDLDTEAKAVSLRQALYRARRRSDTTNASIIAPEYHLVTVGDYDPILSRMPILYNKLPDDMPLPRLSDEHDNTIPFGEMTSPTLPPADIAPEVTARITGPITELEADVEIVIPDFVAKMVRDVKKKGQEDA